MYIGIGNISTISFFNDEKTENMNGENFTLRDAGKFISAALNRM